MGGRGKSSMTGSARKTQISSVPGGSVAKMSDKQLDIQLRSVEANMEKVSDIMLDTANGHIGYGQGAPFGNKADHESYVKAFKEYGSLRERRDAILDERARRAHERAIAQPLKPRTFVNSYGEATTRYVVSTTYERAQKRIEKDILRNMGY